MLMDLEQKDNKSHNGNSDIAVEMVFLLYLCKFPPFLVPFPSLYDDSLQFYHDGQRKDFY